MEPWLQGTAETGSPIEGATPHVLCLLLPELGSILANNLEVASTFSRGRDAFVNNVSLFRIAHTVHKDKPR